MRKQLRIRVHGHRMIDAIQQRDIIVGVAVEGAARQAMASLSEPSLQAAYLTLAKGGGPGDPPGIAPIDLLRVGGNQVRYTKALRDGGRDKGIGGGDLEQQIPGRPVVLHQGACWG
jgi:hypothetical protein